MKVLLRDARLSDAAALASLYAGGVAAGGAATVPCVDVIQQLLQLQNENAEFLARVVETEQDGVVGTYSLFPNHPNYPTDSVYLHFITVDLDYRGHGVGNLLTKDMICIANKLAAHHSKKRLFAFTYLTSSGLISRKMLLKNGFRPADRERSDECYITPTGVSSEVETDDAMLVLDLPYIPPQAEPPLAPPVQLGLVGLFKKLFL